MHSSRGSTRFLLVVVLTVAALLLAASVVVLMRSGDSPAAPDGGEGIARFVPTGESGRERVHSGEEPDPDEGDGVYEWEVKGDREAFGDVFTVTPDSLRKVLADRHWEEIRRQIAKLQENGGEVPMDVVTALIDLLAGDDTRIDAILALGGVTSDAAGTALAEHATNLSQTLESRAAALDALAKNGSRAALTLVQTLATDPGSDPALLRHACPALAGIGGIDAAQTLVDLLARHQDTNLEGMIVQSLGQTRDAGDVLSQAIRRARDARDPQMATLMVRAATIHGAQTDASVRQEILRLIEDPASRTFAGDEEAQLRLRGAALTAAASIGGDLLDPVLRMVRDDTEHLGDAALHCLRRARGDEAAEKIAPLLTSRDDPRFRREVTVVLGETRSFKATPVLVDLLDDDDQNTRHAAAAGLSLVRDPAAAKPLLGSLDKAGDDFAMARNVIDALGTIGANDALPRLRELRDSTEPVWESLRPWLRRAIQRIESGNPDSTRMD